MTTAESGASVVRLMSPPVETPQPYKSNPPKPNPPCFSAEPPSDEHGAAVATDEGHVARPAALSLCSSFQHFRGLGEEACQYDIPKREDWQSPATSVGLEFLELPV